MKRLLLLSILIANGGISGNAQQLTNTRWIVYDTADVFFYFFRFSNNIVSFSTDNINYNDVSAYQENGNNYSIVGLPGSGSTCFDTGRYTFSIQADTLRFTLVNEPCVASNRTGPMCTYHWVRFPTAVSEFSTSDQVHISPNPFHSETTLNFDEEQRNAAILLTDELGREVKSFTFSGRQLTIEKGNLNRGIYFLTVSGEKKNTVRRLVVE